MRVANEADLEAIGRTLAAAFEHDPLWRWVFEDAGREPKLAAMADVFGFFARAALKHRWVRVTAGVEAVAVWIPPGAREMSSADEKRAPDLVAAVCGPQSATRARELLKAFEENYPHGPPHYYLSLLATHPDHAGHGYGLALVADCLAEIDAGDPPAPAFLESSNPANVPLYERFGFRPTQVVELVADRGSTQMWRVP